MQQRKRFISAMIVLILLTAIAAQAQNQVTTPGGTSNAVPKFTGSTTIGVSVITESGGNVGIGTTAPGQKLDVHGDTAFGITTNAFSNEWYSGSVYSSSGRRFAPEFLNAEPGSNVGSDFLLNAYGDNGLYLSTPFAIQRSTGNIGIGTYTPGQKLDVHGDTAFAIFPNGFSNEWYNGDIYAPEKRRLGFVFSGTESGGNAGSDFLINTYSDSGNYLANPLTVKRSNGYVGIGTTNPTWPLQVNGYVKASGISFPDGSLQQTAWTGVVCGGDYAESVEISGERTRYEPGDVLVIDTANAGRFVKSAEPYSTVVAGIYSTKPGVIGRRFSDPELFDDEVPMAMLGIVPTKVSAENGAIRVGDLLVTSATMGHAMRGTDATQLTGAVVGKALGSLDHGTGVIEVLVSLQ